MTSLESELVRQFGLPLSSRLLSSFRCALVDDSPLPYQGRLHVLAQHVVFHSHTVVQQEQRLVIPLSAVLHVLPTRFLLFDTAQKVAHPPLPHDRVCLPPSYEWPRGGAGPG